MTEQQLGMYYTVNIRKRETTYHCDPSVTKLHSRNKTLGSEKQEKTPHISIIQCIFFSAVVHCTEELKDQENKICNKQSKRCHGKRYFKVCQEQKELCNDVGPLLPVEKYD